MVGIHKKLKYWGDAGLISTDQVQAIAAYEKDRTRGSFGRSMTGLALFSIIVGVLSVGAANWAAIPAALKLIVHCAVNAGLAVMVWRADRDNKGIWREGALLVLGGLTLTLIALTGQVFQLGGSLAGALIVWQLSIIPAFVMFGQTRITVIPALLSMVMSVPVIFFDLTDHFPDFWVACFGMMLAVLLPLALIGDGYVRLFRRMRPLWTATSRWLGFVMLTVSASFVSLAWYGDRSSEAARLARDAGLGSGAMSMCAFAVLGVALAALAVHWVIYERNDEAREQYRLGWLYALVSVLMIMLPMVIRDGESSLLAALMFLFYWGFVAWYAHRAGVRRLLSLAIFLLAARIWIIYLEQFGGLLSGGLGLITGGIVMLVMLSLARRVNKKLTQGTGSVADVGP